MSDRDLIFVQRRLVHFRRHLVLTSLLATLGFSFVIAMAVFVPVMAQMSRVESDSSTAAGLAEHFLFLHSALWPVILVSLASSILTGVVLFQRMRAPVVRFVRCFDAIAAGSVPEPIVIRATDYLRQETDALNRMLCAIADRESTYDDAAQNFCRILDELSIQGVDSELIEALRQTRGADFFESPGFSHEVRAEC